MNELITKPHTGTVVQKDVYKQSALVIINKGFQFLPELLSTKESIFDHIPHTQTNALSLIHLHPFAF